MLFKRRRRPRAMTLVQRISRFFHAPSEHRRAIALLQQELADQKRSLSFERQALHDLSRTMFSCRETVSGSIWQRIGVIVTTCDRPLELERALHSLACQSRLPDSVAVVNDGRENVRAIVNRFSDRLKISLLSTPEPYSGSSAARNIALNSLDTGLIAFLDDDNLMWPRWIERALAFFEDDSKLEVVYGAQLRDLDQSTTDKFWFLVPFDLHELKKGNFIDLNQIVHRSSDVRFDESLRRLVDWDYILKLSERTPDHVSPVNAISSIYSTSALNRITVPNWPPDLSEIIAHRQRGEKMPLPSQHRACACCGHIGDFQPGPRGRPNASCAACGSLERHRFLQLTARLLRQLWIPKTRPLASTTILEIAPSHATSPFRETFGRILTVDADPEADGRSVNIVSSLTDLPIIEKTVDVALVLHVLEHIPNDRKAMAEIERVLTPNGIAILQVPLSGRQTTDEDEVDSADERLARYGQADHVRLYGEDFFTRLSDAGLTWISVSPRQSMPAEAIEKYGLLPDEALIFAVASYSHTAVNRLEAFESMLRKGSLLPQVDRVPELPLTIPRIPRAADIPVLLTAKRQ